MSIHVLEYIPMWGIFLITFILSYIFYEVGFAIGVYNKKKYNVQTQGLGLLAGGTLALLVFILAFTFSLSGYLFEERRKVILEETNAVRNAYMRSGYLSEPYQKNIRDLLRDYVANMVEAAKAGTYEQLAKKNESLQDKIWEQVEALADKEPDSIKDALFIQSINHLIDAHFTRVMQTGKTLVPEIIWFSIFFIMILASIAVGYYSGVLENGSVMILVFILAYTAIVLLTVDLDRPNEGLFRVRQQAVYDLYDDVNASRF